jgi:exoribonuclease R
MLKGWFFYWILFCEFLKFLLSKNKSQRIQGFIRFELLALPLPSSDSHYPKGHYVRVIGEEGERKTEDEVILLEHEIPYEEWTPAVLACLPRMPWSPYPLQPAQREDLTHLDICSVDPEGELAHRY